MTKITTAIFLMFSALTANAQICRESPVTVAPTFTASSATNGFILAQGAKLCLNGATCTRSLSFDGTNALLVGALSTLSIQKQSDGTILTARLASATNNPSLVVSGTEATNIIDLNFSGSSGSPAGTISVTGTEIARVSSAGVRIGGTNGTFISGSMRATATLGTGAIAIGATATQNITVTGSLANAECVVGGPTTLEAGLIQSCYVSAAGTVTLRTGNVSLGIVTPAGAQTVSVRVFNP